MVSEMVLSSKGLGADGTTEWSFVCMRTDVNLEVVGFGEFTVAEWTDIPTTIAPRCHPMKITKIQSQHAHALLVCPICK